MPLDLKVGSLPPFLAPFRPAFTARAEGITIPRFRGVERERSSMLVFGVLAETGVKEELLGFASEVCGAVCISRRVNRTTGCAANFGSSEEIQDLGFRVERRVCSGLSSETPRTPSMDLMRVSR